MPDYQLDHGIALIAEQIMNYLKSHPKAADSVEGVARWWLRRQQYEDAKHRVRKALDYLVTRGLVSKMRLADGNIVYGSREKERGTKQRHQGR